MNFSALFSFLAHHQNPRLRSVVHCLPRDSQGNGALGLSLHNLKINPSINPNKYSTRAIDELSLSNEAIKKFLRTIVDEFNKSKRVNSEFINESAGGEIAMLLKNRSLVDENKKSLEDLVKQDSEMKKLAEEEYANYEKELEVLDERLFGAVKETIGHTNHRDIMLEISTGVGGQEAMLFARDLLNMYLGHLDYLGFEHEIINEDTVPGIGGIRHVIVAISGERAMEIMRHEGGVHRVQRIPATEKSGRVHTSTVSVAIVPQPSEIDVVIKDKDVKIETKRASGAGGQHVNSTDSAVRITHLPTGIVVECQTDRSQIRNRSNAMLRLRTLLYDKQLNEQRNTSKESRKRQMGLGTRNEKIRTYNFNQDRVTDHRIPNGTMHNLKGFLEGGQNLQEMQEKLQKDFQITILREAVEKANK